ncbi:MAG TPA: cytochrome P450 [Solirubrobacteraceae bacterium]
MDHARHRDDEPVVFDPATGQWFVFAYDDVLAVLSDPRLTNDRMHRFADRAAPSAVEAVRRHAPWIISPEGSDYDWLRPMLHVGLRHAVGRRAEAVLAAAAHELLDGLLARERFDVVSDYAFAHAGLALADFLGVDRGDNDRLMRWALDIVAFFNDTEITTERAAAMAASAAEMVAYAHALIGAGSTDGGGGFLGLAARTAECDGHELGDEAVGNLALPYLTGQVAVAQLVTNCVWLLLGHEDQRARLAADPALLGGALGETLRYLPPASFATRIALEPIVLRGHRVEPGQTVQLSLAAANRDPRRFPDPDRFDIARRQAGAVGFGHGARSCIGAGLARVQTAIVLQALLDRAPDLARDAERTVVWSPLAGIEGPQALSVRATAAPAARPGR